MSLLTYAPQGLAWARSKIGHQTNAALTNRYLIKQGYSTPIAYGDLVATGTGGNQGYIVKYTEGGTNVLGVFLGIDGGYFDTGSQNFTQKRYWAGTEVASGDVWAIVADSPWDVFTCQWNSATPLTVAQRGLNVDFGGGGAPNAVGQSTGYLDASTAATTATLPLRIIGWSQTAVGGATTYDPTSQNTAALQPGYGYVDVSLNPGACESLLGTGI